MLAYATATYSGIGTKTSQRLDFLIGGNTKLTVAASGAFGINHTVPEARLHSHLGDGEGDAVYSAKFSNNDADNPRGVHISFGGSTNLGAAGDYFLYCEDADGKHFGIDGDGTATFSGSGTAVTSDRRIKTDIVDATVKLDDINKLKVRNFDFIYADGRKKGGKHIGFIADEFKQVFPSMVRESKEKVFGKEYDDLQSIMDSALIPILVKAVQELSAKVEALENA